MVPLIELHAHLEGTITPAVCRELAAKNKIELPSNLFRDEHTYYWKDFDDCVTRVYDTIAGTVRTPEDYYKITYDYLSNLAGQRCVYSELIISPDHAREVGLSYSEMLSGIVAAIDNVRKVYQIDCRLNATLVRHLGIEQCQRTAQEVVDNPHSYVVGFDLAGAEAPGDMDQYLFLLKLLRGAGYQIKPHAGETPGSECNIRTAVEEIGCWRIGHGIQAMKDASLLALLKEEEVLLEISPLSNYFAGIIPEGEPHPIRALYDMGIRVCLNSDDPGLFGTSIYMETQVAMKDQKFTLEDIKQMNLWAAEASFAPRETKARLIKEISSYEI